LFGDGNKRHDEAALARRALIDGDKNMSEDIGGVPMNDPLAYFITWTTYGSWLSGDDRGWVDKPGHFMEPNPSIERVARDLMIESELTLDREQRDLVEKTIADHCRHRNWILHRVSCRTQHVHVVVTAPDRDPNDVMEQFKAWCTRRLKELDQQRTTNPGKSTRGKWWTEGGSKRRLYDEASVEAAIKYVAEDQDRPR
jgi:REP element-mobilizing transposase RayT